MVAKNDITGDDIKTKTSSKEYENNFDRIFRNKTSTIKSEELSKCPNYPTNCFCAGECQKERERAVAQNGNVGYTDEDINT